MKPSLPDPLPTVVVLAGDEDRAKVVLLAELTTRFGKDGDVVSWSKDDLRRPDRELSQLFSDLGSRPLFGGARLIVSRDGDDLVKRTGAGLVKALEIQSGNHLVILMRALDQRTAFAKAVKKQGGLVVCQRPKVDGDARGAAAGELVREVVEEARRLGLEIPPDAALELAGRTGNDLLLLHNELQKLALYRGGPGRIARSDVEALVPRSAAWDQFQLFQEVATGRVSDALRRLRGMFAEGTTDRSGRRTTDGRSIASSLLALLGRRLRLLARYRRLSARGLAKEELQRALLIKNPGQLFYLGREVNLPLVAAADEALAAMLEADRALKRSVDPALVLERLLVRWTSLVRRPGSRPTASTVAGR